ncbi:ABC transporter ATP-binding protein/permease [Erysipelotrichaceae bacterium OttesenSCG-928-M19]|nr:ABC transporter ATP-binding protein/permease [Erysipelotrichaceae bacterium OttesenSCG-928-M19]
MKIVFKCLKTFIIGLLMAILLLFVQAFCDLNLPNYMSNIVNVGIQQNGIENASPQAISKDGMELIKTFVSEEDREKLDANYNLVTKNEADSYQDTYPKADSDFYLLQDNVDEKTRAELDQIFGVSAWTFINTMQEMAKESNQEVTSDIDNIELSDIYASLPMLKQIPTEEITKQYNLASQLDESMQNQTGMVLSKAFYEELGVDLSQMQSNYIFKIGFLMLGIALIGGLATVGVNFFSSRIATGVARNLRRDTFNKIEQFSNAEYDKISTSSLITRSTNDVNQIQVLLTMGIRMICYAPIMAAGGIFMATRKAASMSWVIALAVIVVFCLIMVIVIIAMPRFKVIQKLVDKLNLVSREQLSGLMVVRAFKTQKYEEERFDDVNAELTRVNLFVNRIMVLMQPTMMFVMNGLTVLVVWVGAHQIAESNMQVGDMMAFIQYAMQVVMSFVMVSVMFILVPRAAVSADRIKEVLEMEIAIKDPVIPQQFDDKQKGIVEFDNVSFCYDDAQEKAIDNISFKALPNQTTAIIGSTGAGKTTIANLLMRFNDVSKGSIKVAGVDIREVSQHDLRAKIGYVPQKGMLISGTIESNLKYGKKDLDDTAMIEAAKIAQADSFIVDKEEGYQSEIAQGGKNVSGGQKQRLSIARALSIKPDILFFDDSFSALDFKTDSALRKAISDKVKDTTIIIVAQRVSTIMKADQIIVLDKGKIVGQGKHHELLEKCSEYYEIASSQLSKEELIHG